MYYEIRFIDPLVIFYKPSHSILTTRPKAIKTSYFKKSTYFNSILNFIARKMPLKGVIYSEREFSNSDCYKVQ